jgi:hypothetical protein
MRNRNLQQLLLVTAIAGGAMTLPLHAQQATDTAKPAPAADSAADNADLSATAALIAKANAAAAAASAGKPSEKTDDEAVMSKKAKQFGWRPEVQKGTTVYCRNDAEVGSRFSTKRCVGESQLATLIEQAEFDKDQLKQRGCGGNCGSSK